MYKAQKDFTTPTRRFKAGTSGLDAADVAGDLSPDQLVALGVLSVTETAKAMARNKSK